RCARAGRGAPHRRSPVLGRPRLVIPMHGTDTAGSGGVDTRGMRLSRIERLVVMVGALGLLLWTAAAVAAVYQPTPVSWKLAVVAILIPMSELALLHVRYGTDHFSFTWGDASLLVGFV